MISELEQRILEVLANCPNGTRLRNIGQALGMWHINLISEIAHLEKLGLIVEQAYNDPANMEYYLIFKLKE